MTPTQILVLLALAACAIYRQSVRHPVIGSLLASVMVGALRGRRTRLWQESDGRVFSQGTPVTVVLLLLLVGGKFALGRGHTCITSMRTAASARCWCSDSPSMIDTPR